MVVINPQANPLLIGEPLPEISPSSEIASVRPIDIPAPTDAASPTINVVQVFCVAKAVAKSMADLGYTKPVKRKDVKVLGKQALGMFLVGTDSMEASNFISEHDQKIANKLAYVMAGGDLSEPTLVTEQYLLDIEREAFLSLCSERKTLERIEHMLKTGKPLRN